MKSGTLAQEAAGTPRRRPRSRPRRETARSTAPVSLLVTTGHVRRRPKCSRRRSRATSARISIGEHTLGRAGLQKLVKLPENRGLWLTYARYLTPDGQPIHGKGLEPKVPVDEPDVEFGAPAPTTDPVLDAALERAQNQRPRRELRDLRLFCRCAASSARLTLPVRPVFSRHRRVAQLVRAPA